MEQKITNEQVIADYLNEGCTQRRDFRIGVEVDFFVMRRDEKNACYEEITGIVHKMVGEGVAYYDESGRTTGFYNEYYSLGLEAAAQLRLSIFPQLDMEHICNIYDEFVELFKKVTKKDGYRLETYGYNPVTRVENLKLIPDKQYEYMNAYFKESGSTGVQVMKGTAATQIAIDYEDETDYIRKYRLACVLTPIFSLLTDNSPVYEGKPYLKHLLRASLFKNVDPTRCGIIEGIFSEDFGFDKYAEYIYTREPIMIRDKGDLSIVFRQTADTFYADKELHKTDAEHLLTMVFPEVKTKQYIEICCGDSMPKEYVLAFAALIKGIFYSDDAMEQLEDSFVVLSEGEITEATDQLIKNGYRAKIYGMDVTEAVQKVLKAARSGLPVKEEKYVEPFEELAKLNMTLADHMRESRKIS